MSVDDYIGEYSLEEEKVYTFDEAIDEIGFGLYQFILMQVCGAGWMFDGIELTMTSFILPLLVEEWKLSAIQSGLLGSAVFFGMAFGAQFGGIISDKFGRKLIFMSSIIIIVLFGFLSAFAPEYYTFMLLRFFVGVGLGACVPTDFSLLMEYIPRRNRGIVLGAMNIYWTVGTALECLLAWACLAQGSFAPKTGWRWLVAISSIPGVFIMFSRAFVKESPRFMLLNNRNEEAEQLIATIARVNGKNVPTGVLIGVHPEHKLSVLEQVRGMFLSPYLRLTLVLWLIWFMMSFGSWGFTFIIPIVFSKIKTVNPYTSMLIVTGVNFASNVVTMFVLDRIPRRTLTVSSFIFSGICTVFVGISSVYASILYNSMISVFISGFAWSVVYTYTPESYPTQFRATAMGTCSLWTRLAGTLTPLCGTLMLTTGFLLPFVVYGSALFVAGISSIFLPLETLGRKLDDVAVDSFSRIGTESEKKSLIRSPTEEELQQDEQ
ncbi:hypothetical protein AKO1_012697 [Acrasis kona]|uniref:Major facilitator superfamily (MFS) profile domain-containing protein n=1 Tax=Acrasis kona TaxID=1008807 RepID=A0AAW2YVC3_9EUKA